MRAAVLLLTAGLLAAVGLAGPGAARDRAARPNILFCIADDWGWPHASAYGDPVVRTPTFDRLAREGVLFEHAYVSSPSCTPSRSAILTGQWHWRLEESANLWSTLQAKFPVYPDLLRREGYHTGLMRKGWGPGRIEPGGRTENPAGPSYRNIGEFLAARPAGAPFCFWLGTSDPHRPYQAGSGAASGMDLKAIRLPAAFPDHETIRSDVADYYWEVQRFDREVGEALAALERAGELDNTIVVMTGDHGMPFPRAKCNLYDSGTRVPLALRWPARVKGGRRVRDFVSLTDLAPTFLEAAGLKPLGEMTGRSLMRVLTSERSGTVDAERDHVLFGKERHTLAQERGNRGGYPCRGIRTAEFLYIRNFLPERWPNGVPDAALSESGNAFGDCDGGPTKAFFLEHRDEPGVKRFFDLAFAKRPAEELYDLRQDPDQLRNVAAEPEHAETKARLAARLTRRLRETADPRVLGDGDRFDRYPYYGRTAR